MINRGRSNSNSSSKDEFEFTEGSRAGESIHFTMKGRVSAQEAAHMEHKLERAIQSGGKRIIINMCFVKSFSSAGIRVVLAMYKKLKGMGGTLKIENPSENVRNVIGMVALDELLLK